jgi:hypothetical protein
MSLAACDGEEAVAGCMNNLCGAGFYCSRGQFCCRCANGKSLGLCCPMDHPFLVFVTRQWHAPLRPLREWSLPGGLCVQREQLLLCNGTGKRDWKVREWEVPSRLYMRGRRPLLLHNEHHLPDGLASTGGRPERQLNSAESLRQLLRHHPFSLCATNEASE